MIKTKFSKIRRLRRVQLAWESAASYTDVRMGFVWGVVVTAGVTLAVMSSGKPIIIGFLLVVFELLGKAVSEYNLSG